MEIPAATVPDVPTTKLQCPTCGSALRMVPGSDVGYARHVEACATKTDLERTFYVMHRRWPRANQHLREKPLAKTPAERTRAWKERKIIALAVALDRMRDP